jgi:uncharacterized protein (DUF1501 family)
MTTRRDLMKGLGALASAAALAPRVAHAADAPEHLIIYFAQGGWDPAYVFDAKPDNPDVATPDGGWMQHGALTLWDRSAGENARAFFDTWHARSAVVNGIAVNSLVHEECTKRILTGATSQALPDVAARVAAELGSHCALPYLTLGPMSRTTGVAAKAGRFGYANQLMSLAHPTEFAWPRSGTYRPAPGVVPGADEDAAVQALLARRAQALAGRTHGATDAARVADYIESLDRSARIRESAAGGGFVSSEALFNATDDADKVIAALSEGFSQTALFSDPGFWDTHGTNTLQSGLYEDLFAVLDGLMRKLQAAGLLDRTLVVVMSEMGRTPVLNADNGKDHWPCTSALLLGGGVRSAVVEGTDGGLIQQGVDLHTGAPSDIGVPLFAPDLLATVAHIVGLDAGALYPEGEVIHAVVA